MTIFRLRMEALRLNDEFRIFCAHPEIADMERDIYNAWFNFPAWAEIHKGDYCQIALLFYGNIFQWPADELGRVFDGYTWTQFTGAIKCARSSIQLQRFPFQQLRQGTPAPLNTVTISFDPAIKHRDLIKMFQCFLTKMKKVAHPHPPLSGYFEHQPKAKWDEVARFLDAATHARELKEKRPNAWLPQMMKLYAGHPGTDESRRKTIYSDIKKGHALSYWALRGLFPKSSPPPK